MVFELTITDSLCDSCSIYFRMVVNGTGGLPLSGQLLGRHRDGNNHF